MAHFVTETSQITSLAWLQLPGQAGTTKLAPSDFRKRNEIFQEFVYWVFDSFLIPLIRTNFYVTESNAHRNRLFYFRHDVWKTIAEPALSEIKTSMFEEIKMAHAEPILGARKLGCSQLRLLPKRDQLRPIMNLRRRAEAKNSGRLVGPSINAVLGPLHAALRLERVRLCYLTAGTTC